MDDQTILAKDQADVDAAQTAFNKSQADLKAAQDKLAAAQAQAAYDSAHPLLYTFRQISDIASQVGGDVGAQLAMLVSIGTAQANAEIAASALSVGVSTGPGTPA